MTRTQVTTGADDAVLSLPLTHLLRLTDERGIFEHALEDQPRAEHGYCVDDVARALTFVVHESALTGPTPELSRLIGIYLTFVERAVQPNGAVHNRMNAAGEWTDLPAGGDWWGRAMGALGATAACAADPAAAERATRSFQRAARWDTRDPRARLFAAAGAAEVLTVSVSRVRGAARRLIARADAVVSVPAEAGWPWPEPRLRYANGAVPEALIASGAATGDRGMAIHGLRLLDFLLDTMTVDGHLSLPGTAGYGPGDSRPQFDQQPIEAATLAQACVRAWEYTGNERWRSGVALAWRWFLGDNDAGVPMVDLATGAGYDGLTASGRNANRGAESTLAALTTDQLVRRVGLASELSWA